MSWQIGSALPLAFGTASLIAYGALDWGRIHEIASRDLDDLIAFCEALARAAEGR